MAPPKKTLYEILGVERDANNMDISLAHQRRVAELRRSVPPDPSAQALVQQAFEVLLSETKRAAYDAQLLTAAERSAAAEQSATDLEIGEEEPPKRKIPIVPLAIVGALVALVLFIALRPSAPPPPPPPAPTAARKPAPPRERTATEIAGAATASMGQVMAYSMSGSATPISLAVGIDAGTMVTTCHGITAGGSLVVRVGKEQHPADLTITDESLDLCRLSLTGYTTPPVKMAGEEPRAGDRIFMVAPDAKGELAATEGTIKSLRRSLIEISTPVAHTASGAAVFDAFGNLVGIATAKHGEGPGVHVAIPAAAIAQMRTRTR
jgi:serine protease Do